MRLKFLKNHIFTFSKWAFLHLIVKILIFIDLNKNVIDISLLNQF